MGKLDLVLSLVLRTLSPSSNRAPFDVQESIRRQSAQIGRRGQAIVRILAGQKSTEQPRVETLPTCQSLLPCPEKIEPERRMPLSFAQESCRKKFAGICHGRDDKRSPAHRQQVPERGAAAAQLLH